MDSTASKRATRTVTAPKFGRSSKVANAEHILTARGCRVTATQVRRSPYLGGQPGDPYRYLAVDQSSVR